MVIWLSVSVSVFCILDSAWLKLETHVPYRPLAVMWYVYSPVVDGNERSTRDSLTMGSVSPTSRGVGFNSMYFQSYVGFLGSSSNTSSSPVNEFPVRFPVFSIPKLALENVDSMVPSSLWVVEWDL